MAVPPSLAHPVPKDTHDRIIVVTLFPDRAEARYELRVDDATVVEDFRRSDLTADGIQTADDVRRAWVQWAAQVIARDLQSTLADHPLHWQCERSEWTRSDHVYATFHLRADWALPIGQGQLFQVRDTTFAEDRQPARIDLGLYGGEGVRLSNKDVPLPRVKQRAPIDRRPGDESRLRRAAAIVTRVATEAAEPIPNVTIPPATPPADRSLLVLLDSPQGLGLLLLLAAAFGAVHALTPGHGKAMVAAYLIGSRGTLRHALALGVIVTITHTGAVIAVAAALPWLLPRATPAETQQALGFVGGLLVAGLGVYLLLCRLSGRADHYHLPGTGHHHHHDPDAADTPRTETDSVRWGGLIVLGISGGIIPCWDAIAMLAFAIAAGQLWLGVPLLLAFSFGLSLVLTLLGISVVFTRSWLSRSRFGSGRFVRALPVLSACVIVVMGLWLCRESLTP